MKKTDIAMIILVIAVSAGIAYVAVGAVPFLNPPEKAIQVDTIDRYSADVAEPDPDVFNSEALNPTVDITIGGQDASTQQ